MNKSEQLIACLEGEIAKRDEELAACRVAVENCEVFRARIAELEAKYLELASLSSRISVELPIAYAAPVPEAKAQEPVAVVAWPAGSGRTGGFHSAAHDSIELEPGTKLYTAPSPAGVDGCKCSMSISMLGDGCRHCQPKEYIDRLGEMLDEERAELSDAQAIIDGLRGEVAELRSMLATVSKAGLRVRTERDQQAQRVGELEAALEFACKSLAKVTSSDGSGHADIAVSVLRMAGRKEADASQIVEAYKAGAKWRIDAALAELK